MLLFFADPLLLCQVPEGQDQELRAATGRTTRVVILRTSRKISLRRRTADTHHWCLSRVLVTKRELSMDVGCKLKLERKQRMLLLNPSMVSTNEALIELDVRKHGLTNFRDRCSDARGCCNLTSQLQSQARPR